MREAIADIRGGGPILHRGSEPNADLIHQDPQHISKASAGSVHVLSNSDDDGASLFEPDQLTSSEILNPSPPSTESDDDYRANSQNQTILSRLNGMLKMPKQVKPLAVNYCQDGTATIRRACDLVAAHRGVAAAVADTEPDTSETRRRREDNHTSSDVREPPVAGVRLVARPDRVVNVASSRNGIDNILVVDKSPSDTSESNHIFDADNEAVISQKRVLTTKRKGPLPQMKPLPLHKLVKQRHRRRAASTGHRSNRGSGRSLPAAPRQSREESSIRKQFRHHLLSSKQGRAGGKFDKKFMRAASRADAATGQSPSDAEDDEAGYSTATTTKSSADLMSGSGWSSEDDSEEDGAAAPATSSSTANWSRFGGPRIGGGGRAAEVGFSCSDGGRSRRGSDESVTRFSSVMDPSSYRSSAGGTLIVTEKCIELNPNYSRRRRASVGTAEQLERRKSIPSLEDIGRRHSLSGPMKSDDLNDYANGKGYEHDKKVW